MGRNTVKISASHFETVHSELRAFERDNEPITVDGRKLSNVLFESAKLPDDSADPKDVRTKRRILYVDGQYNRDPETLDGSTSLKDELHYGDDEFSLLQDELDILVKEYTASASVSLDETTNCETVQDCVDLVNQKTSNA